MLRGKRAKAVIVLVAIAALVGRGTMVGALTGVTADADDTTGTDISSVYHSDTSTAVTLGFETFEDFSDSDVNAQWDLDNDGAAGFEDCITLKTVAGVLRATWFQDCGPEATGTIDAVRAAGNKVQITIPLVEGFQQGLGLSSSATSYKYRFTNTNSGFQSDQVPDVTTDSITHTFGADPTPTPTADPTPTPTADPTPTPSGLQTATDTQGVGGTVQAGVLAINALQDSIAFGSITPGQTKTTAVGDIDYTNTLNSGLDWTVSVKATSLVSGSDRIGFTNLKFKPGATIDNLAGTGSAPTPNATETAFTGTDSTTGTPFSDAVTVATADDTIQGNFRHAGGTLKVTVPPTGVPAGNYAGTLQYTIVG